MSLSTVCLSALCVCPLYGWVGCLFVCLPSCLTVCLSVYLSACLPACLSLCLCVCVSVCCSGSPLCQQQTAPLASTMLAALLMHGIILCLHALSDSYINIRLV